MKRYISYILSALVCAFAIPFTGCVHEWPELPAERKVTLHIHHELPWDLFEWLYPRNISRSDAPASLMSRYILAIYPKGAVKEPPYKKIVIHRTDLTREDFDVEIDVPVGDWDIRVWTDNVFSDSKKSPYYNPEDFTQITYSKPFVGGDRNKDSFVGQLAISVPDIPLDQWTGYDGNITLRRPLTSFAFIATDLKEFIEQEETRTHNQGNQLPPNPLPPISLDDYSARIDYTGFLPSVYHHFSDKPIDSSTGMGFTTGVSPLNETEALTGYDYVFINGDESTVRVALNFYHKDGTHIARVASFDIPVKRNRCTIVRGEFLTSKATGSTGIDPGFNGDFNIEYK